VGYKAKKTEHVGAKHGSGAYWGPKKDAKKESSKVRRRNWNHKVREELTEGACQRAARDRSLAKEWFHLDEETLQKHPVSPTKEAPRAGKDKLTKNNKSLS